MIVFIWGDVCIDVDKYTHTQTIVYVNINSFCEFCTSCFQK